MKVRTSSCLIALCICAFSPVALLAAAQAPVVITSQFTVNNEPMANCGDFVIIANGAGSNRISIFSDSDGTPIRLTFQGRYRGTMTNSVTGFSLDDDPSVANIFVDLLEDTQANVGAFFTVTVPGGGRVLIDAGRIVFGDNGEPIFIAGQHRPSDETLEILCDALR